MSIEPERILSPQIELITFSEWKDYELLDSGGGRKLERFGKYVLDRPEPEAIWKTVLSEESWAAADGKYQLGTDQNLGYWQKKNNLPESWNLAYKQLNFSLQITSSRHIGVFPEQACQWDWIDTQVSQAQKPVRVLNLFGYTGIASLAALRAGAKVTHIDASRKAILWAKQNQYDSKLSNLPARWILDDVLKFVRREVRRGSYYEGIILDPPKFGRGPKGEVWDFYKLIPELLESCRNILAPEPVFLICTAYAVKASALTLHFAIKEMMNDFPGNVSSGETVLIETSAKRMISTAMYVRWKKN